MAERITGAAQPAARKQVEHGRSASTVRRPRLGVKGDEDPLDRGMVMPVTRPARVEPDPGARVSTGRDTDLALQILRSRRRDPCAERVAIERDRRRTPAEREAISQDQAEALKGVINAVLDGISLTPEQRQRAIEIAVTELRRVADEEP
jgi:hypothetical protein